MSQNTVSTGTQAGISLRSIRKNFGGIEVIHGLDLEIEGGNFIVFVGPSGCGKSTLLRMIAGLEDVTEGTIIIDGADVTVSEPAKRGIAMVFQSYALYPHMSVRQNLAYGLKVAGTPKDEIERQVAAAAEVLQITKLLDRRPRQLSGGQRQRVAIGRAIVRKPKVFLFDEPLSNLDAELRVSMRIEIAKLHQRLGNTMIYVTHDQTEAMTLADRIVVLRDGKIEQVGTPKEVYEDPNNEFVAGFIGSPRMNLMPGTVEAGGIISCQGAEIAVPVSVALAVGSTVRLGVRPEHLSVVSPSAASFAVRVDYAEYLGTNGYLYCTTSDGEPIVVELRETDAPAQGAEIHLGFDPVRARLFNAESQRLR
ncbi:sn-glycerol-3-phosphate ABC transporter ATP-binding protein UgpC [Devosia sp. BK]|uniref:ABC transporter ATP-binding protein n=1 Tax=Devosia sp. BK TaxID=2871706 RepID=UPI00293ACBF1|nr:sn-glycerol-3-phosphate ABC transporter ATP-binding protein UgpC [Devosia sp. BK]MDV3253708.1 sn-glycerol-3-phosphate ABC transporter ATP-binding protein UgpC [Devosia sp. BK]